MKDRLLAAINLFAVLRNIESLIAMDEQVAALIQDTELALSFSVAGLPKLGLHMKNGQCKAAVGKLGPVDVNLYFPSPKAFNKLIDGKGFPIPTKGFLKLGFMTSTFPKITDALTRYLRPSEKDLEDDVFREKSTILTAYTAFYALAEIARYDAVGQQIAARIQEGALAITAGEKMALGIYSKAGQLETQLGMPEAPLAFMHFAEVKVLDGILRGTLDSYACIGRGLLSIQGQIPMVDNLNKLLALVPSYLE